MCVTIFMGEFSHGVCGLQMGWGIDHAPTLYTVTLTFTTNDPPFITLHKPAIPSTGIYRSPAELWCKGRCEGSYKTGVEQMESSIEV